MNRLPLNPDQRIRWVIKPLIWLAALMPLAWLVLRGLQGELSANPIEAITERTGRTALQLLVLTLAVTPLRLLTGWNRVVRLRRLLGLFAYFYAVLHFLTWLLLDHQLDWPLMIEDVLERPYITIGFTALLLLTPLAATSTTGMMRRLGRNWLRLHRLVYLIVPLVVLHFLWQVKADWLEPAVYGAAVAGLLLIRLRRARARSAPPRRRPVVAQKSGT